MNAPIRIKDPSASNRLYSFSLGFGGMAVLVTVLTLALCLFFVLGVLVGRGHRPETAVPVVAGIMPKEPLVTHGPAPEVLKAEELGYSEQLGKKHEGPSPSRGIDSHEPKAQDKKPDQKSEQKPDQKADQKSDQKTADKTSKPGATASDKAAAKLADQKAEQKPGQKPGQKPADQKPTDQKAQDKKLTEKPAQKPTDKPGDKPDPDTQRYDYAYQAATFPNAESAASYLKRVKGLGLKGDIESGNTDGKAWHRVVVFFQGTPTDTRALKEKLAGIGAQKLVMRSKTPAN